MAAACGPESAALISPEVSERLRKDPWSFEFFQAVRLLESIHPDREPVGRFSVPSREIAKFRAYPSTVFPASEIQSLKDSAGGQADLEVNFMGLFGPIGVLPLYYTELIAERARIRDTALIDFLNIFNHRMISLFYRAWEKYRFPVAYGRGDIDQVGHRLMDFIGLGTPGLESRQKVADEALIHYAGLLSQQPRCSANLETLLADYFEIPVEVEQFVGAWYKLDESTQFCMEDSGDVSEQLGLGAVVGDEVWDTQGRVRIKLGPLRIERYLDFLPSGTAYAPLRAMVNFYGGAEVDFEAQLILDHRDVPPCEIGAEGATAPTLGWLTWARTAPTDRDPGETVLSL